MNASTVDPATAVPEPRFHPPGDKTAMSGTDVTSVAPGIWATATINAGPAGVQRVITGASFSMAAAVAVLATGTIGVQILNGTTMLWGGILSISSNGISPPFALSGMNLLTSAATTVSAGFTRGITTANQFVSLTYHDLGV